MPAKLDRCVEQVMKEQGLPKDKAFAICQESIKDAMFDLTFSDSVVFDPETKKVVSVRDGVQEYHGRELGLEPADRIFKFYRAPETIKAIVDSMSDLPITDDHVSLDEPPAITIGKVVDGELVDFVDSETDSTVKIENNIVLDSIPGNNELSLGYKANVIPCDKYDFEQVDIVPHHLAIVRKGRCGETCKFMDKENDSMKFNKAFLDAEGAVNMQQVLQLVNDLPDAIKTMDLKDLVRLVPILQKATATATESIAEGAQAGEVEMTDEEKEAKRLEDEKIAKQKAEDEGNMTEEEKAQAAKDEEAAAAAKKTDDDKKFSDSVADEVKKQSAIYAAAVVKGKEFLPDTYNFADKSACDIMRDSLATQSNDKFEDSELPVAFKMLKKETSYSKFADKKTGSTLEEIGEKELGDKS